MMPPLYTTMPVEQTQASPFSVDFFDFNSVINNGLNAYMQLEQLEIMKDAVGQGQHELNNTPVSQNPNTDVTHANQAAVLAERAAQGLKIGTGTLVGIVAAVVLLFWLSRK